ncbi:hypothetical protein [Actinoplanes sp. NPDC049599]
MVDQRPATVPGVPTDTVESPARAAGPRRRAAPPGRAAAIHSA